MHQCCVDGEFKAPCNAFACWAFRTPQISTLTVCDCFLEFKQGRCKDFLHFQRQLPTLKKHIYQLIFLKQSISKQLMMVALLPSPLCTAFTSCGEKLSQPHMSADLGILLPGAIVTRIFTAIHVYFKNSLCSAQQLLCWLLLLCYCGSPRDISSRTSRAGLYTDKILGAALAVRRSRDSRMSCPIWM